MSPPAIRFQCFQILEDEVHNDTSVADAGDECLIERAIVGPFGEQFVDCRVVDDGGPVACLGYRQALPLHTW
jgi:hypothetical protein